MSDNGFIMQYGTQEKVSVETPKHSRERYFHFYVFNMNSVASNKIESKDVRSAVDQYLGIGEWVVDQGIMFMSNSKYFYKKR